MQRRFERPSRGALESCGRRALGPLKMGPLKISCLLLAVHLIVQATDASEPVQTEASNFQTKNSSSTNGEPQQQQQQKQRQRQQQASPRDQQRQAGLLLPAGADHDSLKTCSRGRHGRHLQPASLSSSVLRAFIRTNNMRAYHLDLHSYRPGAKFSGDAAFVNSSSSSHQERCRRHLNHYDRLLSIYLATDPRQMSDTLEALRLADTFGRPDAGLLDGHQFWLGSYESCLHFRATLEGGEGAARGQYCLGLAQFPSWNPQDTRTSFKVGLCLPESCTSSMLNEQQDLFELVERMMKYQLGGPKQPLDKLRLRSVYCLPHATSAIRQITLSGKLLISLVSALLLACLYATLHDYLNRKTAASAAACILAAQQQQQQQQLAADSNKQLEAGQQQQQQQPIGQPGGRAWRTVLVESFSISRNFEKIFGTTESPTRAEGAGDADDESRFNKSLFFSSITGIKCIGLIWIIAAHCFLVGPITHKNLINLDRLTQTYLANVYLAAHLMVDTFFALSGLLASYLLFKGQSLGRMKLRNWMVLTVHRYWRLTPVYLLCYWFAKALGHLVNSGPLWDYSTAAQSPRLNCANESWLEAVLYLSDFKSPKSHCVPFAWFIANGIKFSIITPLFLLAIHKSARAGYALLAASILANIGIVVSLAINSNVDMKSVIEFKPESADNMLNHMEEVYTRPYSRIGAYLVGLMAGHMIYLAETQYQPFRMSEKMKILIWSLVSATAIVLTFVLKIADGVELEDAAIPWVFSFCSALIRPLWALCTCWLVFALAYGQARWLSGILSAKMWRVLARLSFCAYLTQGEVIANLYLSQTYSSPYTYTEMLTRPIVATVVTIAVSVVVALIVEYPLIGIEELLLPRRASKAQDGRPGQREELASSGQELPKSGGKKSSNLREELEVETTMATETGHLIMNGNSKGEKLKNL